MEKFRVPDEVGLLHVKAKAAKKVRNLAVKLPFGYRKSLKASIAAEEFMHSFWKKIRELYPEFSGKTVEYAQDEQLVFEHIPDNQSLDQSVDK